MICHNVIHLKQCDSTNNYLKSHYDQLKENLPVLVTSALQTRGRGRQQRTWVSPGGKGLYSSFGFYLQARHNLNLLPLIAGIGVIETVEKVSDIACGLKWPNDVLYKDKKMAGVLIENIIMEARVFSIVGIGINLNHTAGDFPGELAQKALSLKMAAGSSHDYEVAEVNPILSTVFFQWLEKLEKDEREIIVQTANRYSDFLMDKPISFHQSPDRIVSGIYKGINHDGGLILGSREGSHTIYYSGEIV
jgi:BirA family biotin operon repressor/biotin-[acetyl-CoA-carboxylase] ligase